MSRGLWHFGLWVGRDASDILIRYRAFGTGGCGVIGLFACFVITLSTALIEVGESESCEDFLSVSD
jgi:hypothetical protein